MRTTDIRQPDFFIISKNQVEFQLILWYFILNYPPVAQLDRAGRFYRQGWGFESLRAGKGLI